MSICFFNDTATTEIYTLSLHDALPICRVTAFLERFVTDLGAGGSVGAVAIGHRLGLYRALAQGPADRKSTRLNSSHANISYAVFCLKKKYIPTTPLSLSYFYYIFSVPP